MVRPREIATIVPTAADGAACGDRTIEDLRRSRFLTSDTDATFRQALAEQARAHGFDAVAVTRPDAIPEAAARLDQFIAKDYHGDMGWLAAQSERRGNPRVLWPDVRAIIMLGVNYAPLADPLAVLDHKDRSAISVYARGDDYHDVIKAKLKALGRWLTTTAGGEVKVFVDTAAVMEKPLAAAAGLGWQGKHTNLVSRRFGSWLFSARYFRAANCQMIRRNGITVAPARPVSISARPRPSRPPTSSMQGAAFPI